MIDPLFSYIDNNFENNSEQEYQSFQRKYKNYLTKHLPYGFSIYKFDKNYFCFSCIIKTDTNNFLYLSIPDVRYSNNAWMNKILIRRMKNERDYTGMTNYFTGLDRLTKNLLSLDRDGCLNCGRKAYEEMEM